MRKMKKKYLIIISMLVIGILLGVLIPTPTHMMSVDQRRDTFISLKNSIQGEMLSHEQYKCCLEKPCVYCIEKTPGHGEGAACTCLEDVINGVHPCGECIGEILEGHGNPLISEYFAKAIAEKTGEFEAIQKIIEEKYGMPIEQQVV